MSEAPASTAAAGRLQRLLGVAGERHGEDQGAGADEVGGLVPLDHGHRDGQEGRRRGRQHVAGDPAATHAQDHDVLDPLVVGQASEPPGPRSAAALDLLGEAGGGTPHVEGVDAPSGGRGRGGRTASGGHESARSRPVVRAAAGLGLGHQPVVLCSSTAVASSISITGMPSRTS